jgi:hypothetical protein
MSAGQITLAVGHAWGLRADASRKPAATAQPAVMAVAAPLGVKLT